MNLLRGSGVFWYWPIFLSLLSSSNKHQMAKKSTSPFVPGIGGTHASKVMQSLSSSPSNISRWVHLIVSWHRKKEKCCWKWFHLRCLMVFKVTSLCLLSVNPQWKNVKCPKCWYAHVRTVVSETANPSGSGPSFCHPHGHHPTSARVPCPDGPHLLPGTRLSARLSESCPTVKIRHAPRKEPPAHTFTVRFQAHDGTTQSQPQGKVWKRNWGIEKWIHEAHSSQLN